MNTPRETIFAALLTQIQNAQLNGQPAFKTVSRKFVGWDQSSPEDEPAAYLTKGFEHASQARAYGMTTWRLKAALFLYCRHSTDSSSVPGTLLNNLMDSVEAALAPPFGDDRQSLGGLVNHCFIDGEVLISEGALPDDTISIAVVPISIETGV